MVLPRPTSPVLALLMLAIVGCGGDEPAATTTAAPAATTAATKPSTPSGGSKAERVAIEDFEYAPGELDVAVGTKVTWTNDDTANHTVTFDTGAQKSLGNQPKGTAVSSTFTKAGRFAYHCDYHPNMHGTVVVR